MFRKMIFIGVSLIGIGYAHAQTALVLCEKGALTIQSSKDDPTLLHVVVSGQLRNTLLRAGQFLDGFADAREQSSGETVSAGEGRHFDWRELKSGSEFKGMFITGYNYQTNIFRNGSQFFIKVLGASVPGCVTMPDGERVCWGSGQYIEKQLPLNNCIVN